MADPATPKEDLEEAAPDADDLEDEDLEGDALALDEDALVVPDTEDATEDDDDDEDEEAPPPPKKGDGEEEEDEPDPDDVEADLDTILKDRIAANDEDEEEDEEVEVPTRTTEKPPEGPNRVTPRQPGEFVCTSCFLVKQNTQLADSANDLCDDCV